jgi:hypothetical protein
VNSEHSSGCNVTCALSIDEHLVAVKLHVIAIQVYYYRRGPGRAVFRSPLSNLLVQLECVTSRMLRDMYYYSLVFSFTGFFDELGLLVLIHYATYALMSVLVKTENIRSTGLHELTGPCNETVPVNTPFGHVCVNCSLENQSESSVLSKYSKSLLIACFGRVACRDSW